MALLADFLLGAPMASPDREYKHAIGLALLANEIFDNVVVLLSAAGT